MKNMIKRCRDIEFLISEKVINWDNPIKEDTFKETVDENLDDEIYTKIKYRVCIVIFDHNIINSYDLLK